MAKILDRNRIVVCNECHSIIYYDESDIVQHISTLKTRTGLNICFISIDCPFCNTVIDIDSYAIR